MSLSRVVADKAKYKLSDLIKAYEVASRSNDSSNMAVIKKIYDSKNYINDVDGVTTKPNPVVGYEVTDSSSPPKDTTIPEIKTKTVEIPKETITVDPLAINLDLFKPTIE